MKLNKGRNWAFIGVGLWPKICFRSTHVADQRLFSIVPSILTFDFDLFLGWLLIFGALMCYILGRGRV